MPPWKRNIAKGRCYKPKNCKQAVYHCIKCDKHNPMKCVKCSKGYAMGKFLSSRCLRRD